MHAVDLLAHVPVDLAGQRPGGRSAAVQEEFRVERGELLEVPQGDRPASAFVDGREVSAHVVVVAGQIARGDQAAVPAAEHARNVAAAVRVVPLARLLHRIEEFRVGLEPKLAIRPAEQHELGLKAVKLPGRR